MNSNRNTTVDTTAKQNKNRSGNSSTTCASHLGGDLGVLDGPLDAHHPLQVSVRHHVRACSSFAHEEDLHQHREGRCQERESLEGWSSSTSVEQAAYMARIRFDAMKGPCNSPTRLGSSQDRFGDKHAQPSSSERSQTFEHQVLYF